LNRKGAKNVKGEKKKLIQEAGEEEDRGLEKFL
jgi:hypothetical protein